MAPVFGSLLAAAVPLSPISWVTFLGWYLGVRYGRAAWLQRFKGTNKTMLKWALLFYFITLVPLYGIIITFACRAV